LEGRKGDKRQGERECSPYTARKAKERQRQRHEKDVSIYTVGIKSDLLSDNFGLVVFFFLSLKFLKTERMTVKLFK